MITVTPAFGRRLDEAIMFLAVLPVAARTFARERQPVAARTFARERQPVASAVEGGAMFSVAIFGGYALAYAMLELGRAP